ncbi:MAG: S41 family peptidase [Planctomycetota bacterium]
MSRRNLVWLAVILGIAVLFFRFPRMAAEPDPLQRSYGPLLEVDALIRQNYVEPITDTRLLEGAVRGMMRQLDPYSGYIGPAEMESFRRSTTGRYIGIGVETGIHRGQLMVIAPLEDGPAVHAGIRAGDVILAVDDRLTDDLTVSDVSESLYGPAGSHVTLTVRHRGNEEAEDIVVSRGPVSVHGVKGFRHLAPGHWDYVIDPVGAVAYVRVASFQGNTTDDFDAALDEFRETGVQALILDLRFNGGGLMSQAIDMVDRFVSEGIIVSTVTRRQAVSQYYAHQEGEFGDVELVVLINGASASAAEIVAGSLQAHGRATVVGTRSLGKGVVQHVIDLRDRAAALRLTVAYYKLPNGRIIHKTPANAATEDWGIIPDVEVVLTDEELEAIQESRRLVDAAVDFPTTQDVARIPTTTRLTGPTGPSIFIDRQLAKALELVAPSVPLTANGQLD